VDAERLEEEGTGGLLEAQQEEAGGALWGTADPDAVLVFVAAALRGVVAQGDGAVEDVDDDAGSDADRRRQARQADGGPGGMAPGEVKDDLQLGF
jgi:hypothetical protein